MNKRNFMAFLLAIVLVLGVLAGCSGTSPEPKQGETKTGEKPKWQTEKITLKYAGWEDKKVIDKMLKAFMQKYPNITVVHDESINWPWTAALTTAASAGNLPDVMNLENVPIGVENDWLLDLTPYWDKDPDTKSVYPNIAKTALYGGKRYASPASQHIVGVFVNKTLFEKFNVPLPSYNWTFDEMIDLAKKLSDPSKHYYGIDGPWGDLAFEQYLPLINNEQFSWSAYDGKKFNFTHQDWINGYNLKLELRRLKVEENMTGEEKKKVFGDENAWPLAKGHVAMGIDGSWNLGWLPEEMKKAGAELDFYPYPAGKAGQRLPVILDFIGISSTTKHPEAAYALMKWMTWDKEGSLKRLEIYKELNMNINNLPVADYPEVWAKIEELVKTEGLKASIKLLKNAVPDFGKTLPGLNDYYAWLDQQQIPQKIEKGEFTPADKAKEMEDKANEFVQKAQEKLAK